MPRDHKVYLEDIIQSIDKIEKYKKGTTFLELTKNNLLQDAILYNLHIIGEATKHISDDVRKILPDVEWRKIPGLSDILSHAYFGLSMDLFGFYAK